MAIKIRLDIRLRTVSALARQLLTSICVTTKKKYIFFFFFFFVVGVDEEMRYAFASISLRTQYVGLSVPAEMWTLRVHSQ